MVDNAPSVLVPWANFYVMMGSSAAALTGLMFVVITLVTGSGKPASRDGISTFSTPTVVHFCGALLGAAILSVPWHSLVPPAIILGLAGIVGLLYVLQVVIKTRRLDSYTPDLEDWAWYAVVPFVAYGAIVAGALLLPRVSADAPFALAAGVALLVFVGIRNAWDVVTYITIKDDDEPPSSK
jgi:hypothetical protein